MILFHRFAKQTILIAVLVVSPLWVRPCFAQPTWLPPITPATPNGFPQFGGDGSQSSVYDTAHDRLIIFGGVSPSDSNAVSHDTWVLVNASGVGGTPTWTKLQTSNDPPARFRHSAVYDPATNRMIIFGGTTANGGGTFFNDVWVLTNANGLNGTTSPWVQRTPAGGPPDGRSQQGAIYDPGRNAMAVFFGSDPAGTRTWSDVWELQNANDISNPPKAMWQIVSQSGNVPTPVGHFATAYDPFSSRVTIFGGCCGYSNASFVGRLDFSTPSVAWSALTPGGTTPPAGDVSTFGYDAGSNKLVVLDIVPGDGTNGTWLLSDANGIGATDAWTNIIPGSAPGVPSSGSLVGSGYNPSSKRLIDALNNIQNASQVPQVWILKNADGSLLRFPVATSSVCPVTGCTANNAPVSSVFDHSMVLPYDKDDVVVAYTGDTGKRGYGPGGADAAHSLSAVTGDRQISINWNSTISAARYQLLSNPNGYPARSCPTDKIVYSGSATSFIQSQLTNGINYSYRLCITDIYNNRHSGLSVRAKPAAASSVTIAGKDVCNTFKQQNGQPFSFGYSGIFVGDRSCGGTSYLSYDGHPGFDYAFTYGTSAVAATSGIVDYIDSTAYQHPADFNALTIRSTDDLRYKVIYLHLSSYYDPATGNVMKRLSTGVVQQCSECPRQGSTVHVGDFIGYTGNFSAPDGGWGGVPGHLHFEVRKKIGTNSYIAVDPYGWQGCSGCDPYLYAADSALKLW